MLNAAQFSAAKDVSTNKMIKEFLFDEKGNRRGYSAFKNDAKEVTDISNETWLRTEYDTAVRQAVSGEQFSSYRNDADLYPYWQYILTVSDHPREEHLELVGNIYRIGDPDGDAIFPPSAWSCGCGSEQIDDMYLDENGKTVRSDEESKQDLEKHIDPQFRFNAADQGILPKEGHSYFQALPSANDANGESFGITDKTAQPTKLAAKGLHRMVEIIDSWKKEYHSDHNTITFQNKGLLTNIIFNDKSFSAIAKHSAGFEKLDDTVMNPTECWSYWKNVSEQRVTLRNYIKDNYVVQTSDGVITGAYLVDNVNPFRRGCILI